MVTIKYDRNPTDQSLVSVTHTYSWLTPLVHTLMITLLVDNCNPISQDFYDKTILSLQFHQLPCPCGLSGGLTIHAYYYRGIKGGDDLQQLRICRVICSHCLATHALLLSSFVPYSQISLPDQVEVISNFELSLSQSELMDRNNSIDESNIRYILQRYRQSWQQRLLTARISLRDTSLVQMCFSFFGRQFMQIKRTPNIFFSPPT